jgi:hypothetical protein
MSKSAFRSLMSAVLTVGLLATVASAQMSPWGASGGYPNFMGTAPPPHPVKCQPPAQTSCLPGPNMGCPQAPCFNPYACPPPTCQPPVTAEPSVYVGYLFKDRGAEIDIEFENGDVVGITSTRNDFDLQGVWLELAVPFALSQDLSGFVTGAHLFPTQTKARESYRQLNGTAKREWTPDIQWWELNAGLAYRFCPVVSALGGFRWSSFVVSFKDPSDQLGFSTASDDAKLTANFYIPFFGLAAGGEPSCNTSFNIAVLGFPAVPSDVDFQETLTPTGQVSTRLSGKTDYKSGYFLEALGEASMKMNAWSLGAFVRFDFIHTERTRDFTVAGVSRQADIKVDRGNWIAGGKIALAF